MSKTPKNPLVPGDIVQVVHASNGWYPCLVVVEDAESWGVKGYTDVPRQGRAYIRLEYTDIVKVGHIAPKVDPEAGVAPETDDAAF